jgi:hypothetical protein
LGSGLALPADIVAVAADIVAVDAETWLMDLGMVLDPPRLFRVE